MSKKVYNFAGEFKPELGRSSEGEYMGRMLQLGYFRNIMKIPAAIINDNKFSLIEPVKEDLLIERFKNNQFISNEELINFLITNKNIKS
jgi:hypothetical protein